MDLQQDIIRGRAELRPGPVRVEAPLEALLADDIGAPLKTLLQSASYAAPSITGSITEAQWAALASAAVRLDLHLELRLGAPPPVEWISTELAERLTRVVLEARSTEALQGADAIRGLATHVLGRTSVLLTSWDEPVSSLSDLVKTLGDLPRAVELEIDPANIGARDRLDHSWSELTSVVSDSGLGLIVRGGQTIRGGPEAAPIFGPNVLDQCIRSLFRTRPSLCPFPFLNAYVSAEPTSICINPDGPNLPGHAPDPWNSEIHQATRQGFYDGAPPDPCRRCTDLPRVLKDLAATPWSEGPTVAPWPGGAMDV